MPNKGGAPTILVVEDEFASQEVLTLMLEARGYHVLAAADGEEALKQLVMRPVDLVITDYMMPRMDGLTLVDELGRDPRWQAIPVIMMSANDPAGFSSRTQIVAFFGKPLLFDRLLDTVRRLLEQKP